MTEAGPGRVPGDAEPADSGGAEPGAGARVGGPSGTPVGAEPRTTQSESAAGTGESAAAGTGEPATTAPAIALTALERRYGERTALTDITVTVPPGATLAVFGANGAGKTTLLRVLATLLRPHAGTATVLGAELPKEAWRVRGKVGYVGHEPLLYRDLSVKENLLFHARLHKLPPQRVDETLDQVGLTHRKQDPVRDLSRGMVQRAAVARAVLHDPPLLLLDEPRANLDPAAATALEPLIGRESGRTRVIASHDVEAALAEADLALGLKAGRQRFATQDTDAATVRDLYAP